MPEQTTDEGKVITTVTAPEADGDPFAQAEALRLDGNALLAKGDFADASKKYQEGLLILVRCTGPDTQRANDARVALHLNAALAELKRGNLASATDHASGALSIDPSNTKALYRRGMARVRLSEHQGHEGQAALARADFERALELEPGNAEVRAQLKTIKAQLRTEQKELDKSQRDSFKGIFASGKAIYEEPASVPQPAPALREDGSGGHRLMLSAENVSFHYERGVPVLQNLNLELRAGWCVGMVGNNAAGKTTLARLLLGGQIAPTKGRIVHHGEVKAPAASVLPLGSSLLTSVLSTVLVAVVAVLSSVAAGGDQIRKLPKHMLWWHWALVSAVLLTMLLAVKLVLDWKESRRRSRHSVLHVTSETGDKEDIADAKTIETVIGEKLPRRLKPQARKELVVAMLKAGGFQMYNQETGQPVGTPEDYIRDGLQYGRLSGGQRHLIYVLRCFASRPEVMLCDELLGGLDAFRQPRVLHMLLRLIREAGTAVLYITTELHQLRLVANSLGFLHGGTLAELGPAEEVLEFPKHPATKDYVGQYRALPGCSVIGGKLAENFMGLVGDKDIAGPWLPPQA